MHTVMTTNNAYDTILLVDDEDKILSAWTATLRLIQDYLQDGANASEWESDIRFTPDENVTISEYGREVGRDGQIDDERRAEYWEAQSEAWQKKQAARRKCAIRR